MPITIAERFKGRGGDTKARQIKYLVRGTDDDQLAIDAIINSPDILTVWNGFPLRSVVVEQLGDDIWEANVGYGEPSGTGDESITLGSVQYSFDTSVEMVKVTHSLETVSTYGSGPDFKQGINPKDDGTFEGVERPVPSSSFQFTFRPAGGTITEAYQRDVEAAVGKYNSALWRSRAAGEVMLWGVSGSIGTQEAPAISFKFRRKPNVSGIAIGDVTGIAKKGWEYLWVYAEKEEIGGKMVPVPQAVYVERLTETVDFASVLLF